MMDGRDLINLADWIEDRKDAVGPYPNHINDGLRRYGARIHHHDDVVRKLAEEMQQVLKNAGKNWMGGFSSIPQNASRPRNDRPGEQAMNANRYRTFIGINGPIIGFQA